MKERVLIRFLLSTPGIVAGSILLIQPKLIHNLQNRFLLLPISFAMVYLIIGYWLHHISRKNEEQAKKDGFESFKQRKTPTKLGFSSSTDFEKAKSLGFLSTNIKSKASDALFKSAEEMKLSWQLEQYQLKSFLPKIEIFDIKKNGNSSKSLIEIINDHKEIEPIANEIDRTYALVSKTYYLQNDVIAETSKIKKSPFVNIDNSELDNLYLQTQRNYSRLQELKTYKNKVWNTRKEWLQPLKP